MCNAQCENLSLITALIHNLSTHYTQLIHSLFHFICEFFVNFLAECLLCLQRRFLTGFHPLHGRCRYNIEIGGSNGTIRFAPTSRGAGGSQTLTPTPSTTDLARRGGNPVIRFWLYRRKALKA